MFYANCLIVKLQQLGAPAHCARETVKLLCVRSASLYSAIQCKEVWHLTVYRSRYVQRSLFIAM